MSYAVNRAFSMIGSRAWAGKCERFVRTCFGFPSAYPSAKAAYYASAAAGRIHRDFNAPPGVPVFWNLTGKNAPYGHVAISIGGGRAISSSNERGRPGVCIISIAGFTDRTAPYLGWAEVYHGHRVYSGGWTAPSKPRSGGTGSGKGKTGRPTGGGKHTAPSAPAKPKPQIPTSQPPNTGGILNGIDVHAKWQKDWKPDMIPGVSFTITKCTGGKDYTVAGWQRMIANANLKGLYHWGREAGYEGTAEEEAMHFVEAVAEAPDDTVLFLDWEDPKADLNDADWVLEWLRIVEEETGRKPIFYNSHNVLQKCPALKRVHDAGYDLWLARYMYTAKVGWQHWDPPDVRWNWKPILWQYSSAGGVPGWKGNLDLNIFYGDAAAWRRLAQQTDNKKEEEMHIVECVDAPDKAQYLIGPTSYRHLSYKESQAFRNILKLQVKHAYWGDLQLILAALDQMADHEHEAHKKYDQRRAAGVPTEPGAAGSDPSAAPAAD